MGEIFTFLSGPLEDSTSPKQTYRSVAKPMSVSGSFPWNIAVEISSSHSDNHAVLAMWSGMMASV